MDKKIGVNDCKCLVDKVKQKLGDWKNKSLTYAGRAQLLASVLSSMQVYWGSVFKIPKNVIVEIETLFKGFLWCNSEVCKGKARVAWKEVCKPKDKGGLGLKSLELWNKTLLIKHLWNVASNKESLWVKWINTVKLKGRSVWDVDESKSESWCWKTILEHRKFVEDHICYEIGNGKDIYVWHDKWNGNQAFAKTISKREIFASGVLDQCKLCDAIDDNGWKWNNNWANRFVCLQNLNVPILNEQPDKVMWISNDGKKVNYAIQHVLKDIRGEDDDVSWANLVWFSNCIPRHTFILWLAVKKKLVTQDKLLKWYPHGEFKCPFCNDVPDSYDHIFFKCKYAREVWESIKVKARITENANTWDGIVNYLAGNKQHNHIWIVIMKLCLVATVYFLWQERNSRIFKSEEREKNVVIKLICDEVRARLMTLKTKKSRAVMEAEQNWDVNLG